MSIATKRIICQRCQRPRQTCICKWIEPVTDTAEVLILQHPLEVRHAKGSGRLLHLCLPNSRLVIGERFDEAELHGLLYGDFVERNIGSPVEEHSRYPVLLYPETPEDQAMGIMPPPALEQTNLQNLARLRLVVLDGTWRKSRKQLYLNPLLQQLPRLALHDTPSSHYLIRKAHKQDQLSTFEATCYALMQLEGNSDRFRLLFNAFDGFVAQQMEYGFGRARTG